MADSPQPSASPVSLVTLVGSLRAGSYNAAIARALPELAPDGVAVSAGPSVADIPLYNQDVQDSEGFPARVREIADAVRAADGVIFVTPEYNYSVPGALKNAIDWVSRLKDQPFRDKPYAIHSASRGVLGGVRAQLALRQVMVFLGGVAFTTPEVFVGQAHTKIDESGTLVDAGTREFLTSHLAAFADFVRRVR